MAPTRDIQVQVRLNDDEALRLDSASRAIGVTRSTYLRIALLEKLSRDEAPPKSHR